MEKTDKKVGTDEFLDIKKQLFEIDKIVNICLASSKIRKLIIKEPKCEYSMRPTIHLFLRSQIGSGKSTILNGIAKEVKSQVMTEITQAGLIGTIDGQTKQLIPAKAWECRNNLLLLDEFKIARNDWGVFLQLLESQTWDKKFGMFSAPKEEKDGDLFFGVKDGNIRLKTRFSCIIATMKRLEFMRGQDFRAFLSRCLIHQYHFGLADLDFILQGHKIFEINHKLINRCAKKKEIIVSRKNYKIILEFVKEIFRTSDVPAQTKEELLLRCVGDCCRIFAVLGKHDKPFYQQVILNKFEAFQRIGIYYGSKKEKQ